MKNRFGFTITELIIALVIVGILSLISVPAYRGYVKKGMASEAKALLGEIDAAQQIYYSRYGKYYAGTAGQSFGTSFGVDARKNKYFTVYQLTTDGGNYTATTTYKSKNLTIRGSLTGEPVLTDNFTSNID
jgi:type IV pilus assembly protein PilE